MNAVQIIIYNAYFTSNGFQCPISATKDWHVGYSHFNFRKVSGERDLVPSTLSEPTV